jgi:hypothetical protein
MRLLLPALAHRSARYLFRHRQPSFPSALQLCPYPASELLPHTSYRQPPGSHLPADTRRQCGHLAAGRDTGNADRVAVHAPGEDAPGFRCRHDFRALAAQHCNDPSGRRVDAGAQHNQRPMLLLVTSIALYIAMPLCAGLWAARRAPKIAPRLVLPLGVLASIVFVFLM